MCKKERRERSITESVLRIVLWTKNPPRACDEGTLGIYLSLHSVSLFCYPMANVPGEETVDGTIQRLDLESEGDRER